MYLMKVMSRMKTVLVAADAPDRQLRGVANWRADVEDAMAHGGVFDGAAGMRIDTMPGPTVRGWSRPQKVRFIFGDPTHRAWLDLCDEVMDALSDQQTYAIWVREAALALAEELSHGMRSSDELKRRAKALAAAKLAEQWWTSATNARTTGRALMRREDQIMRPVGEAIALAGGINQVARVKHYHQVRL